MAKLSGTAHWQKPSPAKPKAKPCQAEAGERSAGQVDVRADVRGNLADVRERLVEG